jgi:hypothetical protein
VTWITTEATALRTHCQRRRSTRVHKPIARCFAPTYPSTFGEFDHAYQGIPH